MNELDKTKSDVENKSKECPPEDRVTVRDALHGFIAELDSLGSTLPLTMFVISATRKNAHDKFKEFEKRHVKYIEEDGKELLLVESMKSHTFNKLYKRLRNTNIASSIVPRSFLVSMVKPIRCILGGTR